MNYKLKKYEIKSIINDIKNLGVYPLIKSQSKNKGNSKKTSPEITITIDDKLADRLIVQIKNIL